MDDSIATIAEALRFGKRRLRHTGSDTPGLDAEVLLRHAMALDRVRLFARLADPIDAAMFSGYQALLDDRARGVPVAYLTGEREFMGLPFTVGAEVLIPRPETEILVEWALRWLRSRPGATVVDVGTGSGAIALSLAASLPTTALPRIVAIDVSPAALEVAAYNRTRLGMEDRVILVQGSLLAPIAESVDLVLANLPYLRPDQISGNPQLAAEPRIALDGGVDGLDLVRQLLRDAPRVVARGGALALELDPGHIETVIELARDAFPGAHVDILRDLAGLDRFVVVQLESTPGTCARSATMPRARGAQD